jgi:glycosyltransferase involved in cell wall biosynthesis
MTQRGDLRVAYTVHDIGRETSGLCLGVRRLAEVVRRRGINCVVATVDRRRVSAPYLDHQTFPVSLGMRRLGLSRGLHQWLDREASSGSLDAVHSHGLWSMTNVYPGWVCRRRDVPLVVSVHGSLAPWPFSRGSRVKPAFWRLTQRPAIERASLFHATCPAEVEDIRAHGFRGPIAVIPLGVDVPDETLLGQARKEPTLAFLGRIHPTKRVGQLIHAWAVLEQKFAGWKLEIAGPDQGAYAQEMKALVAELGLRRVTFVGELKGDAKFRFLARASLFVLPTHSENFGMAIAEALACGTPTIVTRGAPWGRLSVEGAGWWIDDGHAALVSALENAMSHPLDHLQAMGKRGRDWMLRDYDWQQVGALFALMYRWLRDGMEAPSWIER